VRKSFLLLLLLLAVDPAAADVSDAAYCANARGAQDWPYRCFNSLEGAEAWIRQDEGASDRYVDTYGEGISPTLFGDYVRTRPDSIAGQGRDESTPPQPIFWVAIGGDRGLNPNGWSANWALYKWQWFECGAQLSPPQRSHA
jgi:hypothetical protein